MLARLAHFVARHRWAVIGGWIALTLFGAFAASRVASRWTQSFSIPGYSAYEANARTQQHFGTGMRPPKLVVFRTSGDATRSPAIRAAMTRAELANPGARTSSFYSTGSLAYVSRDRHTAFLEIYPPGEATFDRPSGAAATRRAAATGLPGDISVHVTGHDPLVEASKHGDTGGGTGVLLEFAIGAIGALVILLFVFGTLPAVLIPLAIAIAAILNTFSLVWALTYVADVSIIVQFLIALVGLGVAIDYALLMIMRFRAELREGHDVETALAVTMTHAGRSVIISGSTVAIGLLSLVILPLPFLRSIGIAGLLIPALSVLAAITLLPALLAVLGERINSVRLLPRRWFDRGHEEAGAWGRWARLINRRPRTAALAGLAIVGALAVAGTQLNLNEAPLKSLPGGGDAIAGRDALAAAGISPGVMKPFDVLVENGADPAAVAAKLRSVGVAGAAAPTAWRKGDVAIVEAFPAIDGSADGIQETIDAVNHALQGTTATLGGIAAADRDFVHAIYGNFPYVLAFVVLLTLILLARAFRSIVLALKAVLLNLASLAAAFGVVVLVFQLGYGSSLWDIDATQAINPWIPLLIFAFLYGLSMDYEVFMLTRMREAYDETGSTERAIELGLARTGKLVTSAALILMFAFLVLSTGPGVENKELAIGLAAGIIFDATVIRALLMPALMRLLGEANWWMPRWTRSMLLLPEPLTSENEVAHPVGRRDHTQQREDLVSISGRPVERDLARAGVRELGE